MLAKMDLQTFTRPVTGGFLIVVLACVLALALTISIINQWIIRFGQPQMIEQTIEKVLDERGH